MADNRQPVEWFLPAAFYFSVKFQGESSTEEVAFKEASGLSAETEVESVSEGGMNDHTLLLPKGMKHGNLVLRRAVMSKENDFGKWIHDTLEGGFLKPIKPKDVEITLLDETGAPMYCWVCKRAWPVKWSAEGFDSQRNELAVESIELAYTTLKREK